jgi:MoxR-like ATPase
VAEPVLRAVARAVLATRPDHPGSPAAVRRFVRHGVSPRGLQALLLAAKVRACLKGRFNVSVDDVCPFWLPALRHRVILDPAAGLEGMTADRILGEAGAQLGAA